MMMGREVVPVMDPGTVIGGLKKKGTGSRSWLLIDVSGQETVLEVDKYEIMHRVQIHARDLRIIDPLLSYPSTIMGRERAIVLNLEHIKAIITSEECAPRPTVSLSQGDSFCCVLQNLMIEFHQLKLGVKATIARVLLRDPSDENVTPVVEELRRRLKPMNANREDQREEKDLNVQHDIETTEEDESPFEFRALEVALEAICSYLAARTLELETAVYPALDMLTSKISSRNLDRVRKLKSQMTRLTARVQKVRDELEQLLDDDDDMADLYLSRKLAGASPVSGSGAASWFLASPTIGSKISRASRASIATVRGDENDVEELEMLLEAYFMQIDGTFNKLTTESLDKIIYFDKSISVVYFGTKLREYIDNTEDYINIQLDNHRNQLIQLELFLSSGTVCLSIYSLIAGIFGMNIPYSWNNGHGYMFKWVVIGSGIFCTVFFILIISYARYKGLVGS